MVSIIAEQLTELKPCDCVMFGTITEDNGTFKFNVGTLFKCNFEDNSKQKPRRKIYKLNNITQSNNNEVDFEEPDETVGIPKTFTREKDSPIQQHYFLKREFSNNLNGGLKVYESQKNKISKERL